MHRSDRGLNSSSESEQRTVLGRQQSIRILQRAQDDASSLTSSTISNLPSPNFDNETIMSDFTLYRPPTPLSQITYPYRENTDLNDAGADTFQESLYAENNELTGEKQQATRSRISNGWSMKKIWSNIATRVIVIVILILIVGLLSWGIVVLAGWTANLNTNTTATEDSESSSTGSIARLEILLKTGDVRMAERSTRPIRRL